MKIGVLSMQKVPNYGSFLQAYSLKNQFEKRGHEVYFVDILTGRQIVSAESVKDNKIKKIASKAFDKYVFKRIAHYFFYKKMCKIHTADHERFLETEKKIEDAKFDLVVIGSDEVFNCFNPSPWGFSPQLLGKVENAKKVVSYAASCGNSTYEDAVKYDVCEEIRSYFSEFSNISVRDENSKDFVTRILGTIPQVHLDPVFITDFELMTIPERKPYILIYAYSNRICDKKEIQAIKDYARRNKLQILSVGTQQRWCNHNITASAFELLSYVKNSECVITDTFHGTVFSIKYNKKFGVFIRESNRNKLGGLLERFGLYERVISAPSNLSNVMDAPIDFLQVNSTIKNECVRAYDYFDKILNEVE